MREGFKKNQGFFKKDFEKSISKLNELVQPEPVFFEQESKDEMVDGEDNEEIESLQRYLEASLGGPEAADRILKIQQEKVLIMEELKESIDLLKRKNEDGEYMPVAIGDEDATGLTVGEKVKDENGKIIKENFLMFDRGGGTNIEAITEGQVLVSGMWDEDYRLEESVSRKFKRKYIFARARAKINDLYNKQIALAGSNLGGNKASKAYASILKNQEEGIDNKPGIIAEKMVLSYMSKLNYDYDLPFKVKEMTALDDVKYKIDFLLEMKEGSDLSGVKVDEPDQERGDVGIQFTTDSRKETQNEKSEQIKNGKVAFEMANKKKLKDLVIVTLPMKRVANIYNNWKMADARTPGGPDEAWSEDFKKEVFMAIVENALGKEVAEQSWQIVSGEADQAPEPNYQIAA